MTNSQPGSCSRPILCYVNNVHTCLIVPKWIAVVFRPRNNFDTQRLTARLYNVYYLNTQASTKKCNKKSRIERSISQIMSSQNWRTSVCKGTITGSLWVTRVKTVSVSVLLVIVSVTVPKSVGASGNSSGTRSDTASGCLIVTVTTADGDLTSEGIIASKLDIPLYGFGQGNTRLGDGWWGGTTLLDANVSDGIEVGVLTSSKFSFELAPEFLPELSGTEEEWNISERRSGPASPEGFLSTVKTIFFPARLIASTAALCSIFVKSSPFTLRTRSPAWKVIVSDRHYYLFIDYPSANHVLFCLLRAKSCYLHMVICD